MPFDPSLYDRLESAVLALRDRVKRPLGLVDKLLLSHLVDPVGQELAPGEAVLRLRPDRVVLQDVLGQTAFLQLARLDPPRVAVPTSVHCDHLVEARVGAEVDLADAARENDEVYTFLRSAAARFGADFWGPGAGIVHQVVLESYAAPGLLVLGTDSHTPNASGLGACAIGVGGADAVEAMAGLPFELLHPRRIGVVLTGALDGWAAPKDVALWLLGQLGVSGATNAVVEYLGPGARSLAATGAATIANLGAEMGATTSLFPTHPATLRYLAATGRPEVARAVEAHAALFAADPEVEAEPERFFDRVLRLDLSALEPHVAGPGSPDRVRPLSRLRAELEDPASGLVDALSAALVGSCTNSSTQDLGRVAAVAADAAEHGARAAVPLLVTPGSERVVRTARRDGVEVALAAVGAEVLASACGPCIGQWRRETPDRPNSIVTSYNRNFPGRNDGRPTTMSYIASPELVMAFALAGRLSFDPRTDELRGADGRAYRLRAPPAVPDVPELGLVEGRTHFVAPPEDGRGVSLALRPGSERLAPLPRFAPWDGRDAIGLPVLIKCAGKTTTDQISPAGPWLRYRGHLERFSDNLLSGAVRAETGVRGRTTSALDGEDGPVSAIARRYRAAGVRWVVVGDHNYGEGSSREHAALSPRLLGGFAVIARSFARIHETNLKKQGVLALTFADPADYDAVATADRVDLVGLADLAPGRPVEAVVHRADGATRALALRHGYSATQLAWFRAGSALDAVAR